MRPVTDNVPGSVLDVGFQLPWPCPPGTLPPGKTNSNQVSQGQVEGVLGLLLPAAFIASPLAVREVEGQSHAVHGALQSG